MARQTSAITFTRKFGNAVGSKGLNGGYNMRIYVPGEDIDDPKTPLQTEQRAKFAIAAKVAGMLGVLGEQVLFANGHKTTRRGKLVQQIYSAIQYSNNTASLSANMPLILNPKVTASITERDLSKTAPTAIASGSLAYTFTVEVDENSTLVRTIVCMMIYDRTDHRWTSQCIISTAKNPVVRQYVSQAVAGHTLDIYCYSLVGATFTKPGSNSATMSPMDSDEGTGFAINVLASGVTTTELGYAQVDGFCDVWEVPEILGNG